MKRSPSPRSARRDPPARPLVIVVEDEPVYQKLVRAWLSPDFDLLLLPNGEGLVGDAASLAPSAVVLDMNLPGRGGSDLCRDLRADARTAALPIVFLTAQAGQEGFADYVSSGGDAFIPKSSSPNLLRRTLWSFLEGGNELKEKP